MSVSKISTSMCPDFAQEPERFRVFIRELKTTRPSKSRAELMLAVVEEVTKKIEDRTSMLPASTVCFAVTEILPVLGLAEQYIQGNQCPRLRTRIDYAHRNKSKPLMASPV